MPLKVGQESVFCLDFTHQTEGEFIPFETTIPEIICKKASSNRVAYVFHSENITFTHEKIKNEMEQLAAGFLSIGLGQNDRIFIAGHNHSLLLISALAAARLGMVFTVANPNFTNAEHLQHLLSLGQYKAAIFFGDCDKINSMLLGICPELGQSARGQLKLKKLPKLSHILYADENHKHSGTYTPSEIFGKGTKEWIGKLPNYKEWNSHNLCAIQFTMGTTGLPKSVGLSHYQLINGSRIAANAIGIKKETILSCALPVFRIPVFCLVSFLPFIVESQTIFSEPSPLPRMLFDSINKYRCTNMLSNAAALKLLLRTAVLMHKGTKLPTIDTVILLGERVSAELLTSIEPIMPNAKRIAVGMICTEVGAIPILSDNTTNLVKAVGKVLDGYQADVEKIEKLGSDGRKFGELRLTPLAKTKFIGYGPKFDEFRGVINTGDVVSISSDGNIEIVTHTKLDLIFDRANKLVEHWKIERAMTQCEQIKGVQVVQTSPNGPIIAVIMPKSIKNIPTKSELLNLCHENNLVTPDQFAIAEDFPRINTKIQKYKIREQINSKTLTIY